MIKICTCITLLLLLLAPLSRAEGIILTDNHMTVLYSEDKLIAEPGKTLNIIIAPYAYNNTRIAAILNENGEVVRAFLADEDCQPLGDAPIFPEVSEEAYVRAHEYYDELEGLTSDLYYYLAKDIPLKRVDRLALVDFVNWEKEQETLAGGARLYYLPLSDERRLFVFSMEASNNP